VINCRNEHGCRRPRCKIHAPSELTSRQQWHAPAIPVRCLHPGGSSVHPILWTGGECLSFTGERSLYGKAVAQDDLRAFDGVEQLQKRLHNNNGMCVDALWTWCECSVAKQMRMATQWVTCAICNKLQCVCEHTQHPYQCSPCTCLYYNAVTIFTFVRLGLFPFQLCLCSQIIAAQMKQKTSLQYNIVLMHTNQSFTRAISMRI